MAPITPSSSKANPAKKGPITRSSSKANPIKKGPTTRSSSKRSLTKKTPPKTPPTEDWVIVPDKDLVVSPIPSWSEEASPGRLGETTSTNLSAIDSNDSIHSIHKYLAIRPFPSLSPEQSPTKEFATKVNTSSTNMSSNKKAATKVASTEILSNEMPATDRVNTALTTTTVDGHYSDVDDVDSYIDSDIDSDASEQKRIKIAKRPKLIVKKPVAKKPDPEPTTEELEEIRIRVSKARAFLLPILMEMEGEDGVGEWMGKEVKKMADDIERVEEKMEKVKKMME